LKGDVNFYFLRHGESMGNKKKAFQGRSDFDLSEEGEKQAGAAGAWFRDRNIERVYTSPLKRSMRTAEIVADISRCPKPETDERLMELDTGIFFQLTPAEVEARYPAEWLAFKHNSWDAVPGAEKITSLRERSIDFWNYLIEESVLGIKNFLIVAHSGIIQWLIKVTFDDQNWMPLFPISNCGIFKLSASPSWESRDIDRSSFKSYVLVWDTLNHKPY
jgi:broad specificity phosphatase PhoE